MFTAYLKVEKIVTVDWLSLSEDRLVSMEISRKPLERNQLLVVVIRHAAVLKCLTILLLLRVLFKAFS